MQFEVEPPYDAIDCEIRRLVYLINQFAGVSTVASCAGHKQGDETEIVFIGDSHESVSALIEEMPFWGLRAGFANNQPQSEIIWGTFAILKDRLTYTLRIGGSPHSVQRRLIGEVEESLSTSLAQRLQKTHLPSATYGCCHNADS